MPKPSLPGKNNMTNASKYGITSSIISGLPDNNNPITGLFACLAISISA